MIRTPLIVIKKGAPNSYDRLIVYEGSQTGGPAHNFEHYIIKNEDSKEIESFLLKSYLKKKIIQHFCN